MDELTPADLDLLEQCADGLPTRDWTLDEHARALQDQGLVVHATGTWFVTVQGAAALSAAGRRPMPQITIQRWGRNARRPPTSGGRS